MKIHFVLVASLLGACTASANPEATALATQTDRRDDLAAPAADPCAAWQPASPTYSGRLFATSELATQHYAGATFRVVDEVWLGSLGAWSVTYLEKTCLAGESCVCEGYLPLTSQSALRLQTHVIGANGKFAFARTRGHDGAPANTQIERFDLDTLTSSPVVQGRPSLDPTGCAHAWLEVKALTASGATSADLDIVDRGCARGATGIGTELHLAYANFFDVSFAPTSEATLAEWR